MAKPDRISVIYIASTPEKVWAALTDAEFSRKYFFDHRFEIGGAVGAAFAVRKPDGAVDSHGKVLVHEPPHRLRVSWEVVWLPDLAPAEVEFVIDDLGEAVRLSVAEFFGGPIPESILESGRQGWALILSGIKTLMETGRPLPPIKMEPPK